MRRLEVKQRGCLSHLPAPSRSIIIIIISGWLGRQALTCCCSALNTGFTQLCFRLGPAEGVPRCFNRNTFLGEEFLLRVFITSPADTDDICLSPGRQPILCRAIDETLKPKPLSSRCNGRDVSIAGQGGSHVSRGSMANLRDRFCVLLAPWRSKCLLACLCFLGAQKRVIQGTAAAAVVTLKRRGGNMY